MGKKFSIFILAACGIVLFSCNSDAEKKNDTSVAQTNRTTAETQIPNEILQLEKQVEQDSQNVELRTTLAASYYKAGVLDKAAFHFLKLYEKDNNNLIVLSNLGNIYYDAQQDDKAIDFYEKALVLDPNNIDMRCDLATCYGRINRMKKAIQILKENIKMDASHEKSHHNLAVWLKQNGNTEEAEAEMNIYTTLAAGKK